jgi:uncharacterized UBP type Zn finger protein
MIKEPCQHLEAWDKVITATKHECAECVKIGSEWVHLRTCQTCGVTLCCDASPNQHATKHFKEAGHPVIISSEVGERWAWCYQDEQIIGY